MRCPTGRCWSFLKLGLSGFDLSGDNLFGLFIILFAFLVDGVISDLFGHGLPLRMHLFKLVLGVST